MKTISPISSTGKISLNLPASVPEKTFKPPTDSASAMYCSLLSLGCIFGFAPPHEDTVLTALRALKIAQRRLRPEVRSKLLHVSSARTDGSLRPEAWRFTFLDNGTSGHSRVVTVAAKTSSEHPATVEAFQSTKPENIAASHTISQNKILVDSSKALEKARTTVKLKGVHGAEYQLIQRRGAQEPVWNLSFFAEGKEPVAIVRVGAKTGTVEIAEKEAQAA